MQSIVIDNPQVPFSQVAITPPATDDTRCCHCRQEFQEKAKKIPVSPAKGNKRFLDEACHKLLDSRGTFGT